MSWKNRQVNRGKWSRNKRKLEIPCRVWNPLASLSIEETKSESESEDEVESDGEAVEESAEIEEPEEKPDSEPEVIEFVDPIQLLKKKRAEQLAKRAKMT